MLQKKVAENPSKFDELLAEHGGLQFQALLKLEHQPRFYYWIAISVDAPGTFTGKSLLSAIADFRKTYKDTRRQGLNGNMQSNPAAFESWALALLA